LYFGAKDGFFYALDRSNGRLLWRLSLSAPIEVSPVFAQGRFYVRTSDGRLHVIEWCLGIPARAPLSTTKIKSSNRMVRSWPLD